MTEQEPSTTILSLRQCLVPIRNLPIQGYNLTAIDHVAPPLHHDSRAPESGLREIKGDENEGYCPAVPWEGLGNHTNPSSADQQQPLLVSLGNGFMTLAVGESKTLQVDLRPEPRLMKCGER